MLRLFNEEFQVMVIIKEQGKFLDDLEYLYHIDTNYMGFKGAVSAFCYWDGNLCLLMDVATSNEVGSTIKFIEENNIPYSKIIGITSTHYHFDHMGGATKLWEIINKKNTDFKIIVPQDTHDLLQNAENHLKGADTTFTGMVGTMDPAPENAYQIVKRDVDLPIDLDDGYSIRLISTPGHTPDFNAPTIFKNGETIFCFAGEAAGNQYQNNAPPVSSLTSMPPNFNFEVFLKSLEKIIALKPHSLGMNHFGAIVGAEECMAFLRDSENHVKAFRNDIIKCYQENHSTRYIIEKIGKKYFDDRGMLHPGAKIALTYGMMIDLGYRKSKYEKRLNYVDD
ncbi:MAG: MBL fold metallo-hydrolase [Promethearchaeota archaeon]